MEGLRNSLPSAPLPLPPATCHLPPTGLTYQGGGVQQGPKPGRARGLDSVSHKGTT